MKHYILGGRMILRSVWKRIMPGKAQNTTRSRRPVELVYLEQFETKEEAMRREYAIKHMTRRAKLGLVMSYKETGQ